jgi:hypothetical protein
MSIAGNMSVGVRSNTKGVNNTKTIAATTNVYGRRSAKRTIHISFYNCCVTTKDGAFCPKTRSRAHLPVLPAYLIHVFDPFDQYMFTVQLIYIMY